MVRTSAVRVLYGARHCNLLTPTQLCVLCSAGCDGPSPLSQWWPLSSASASQRNDSPQWASPEQRRNVSSTAASRSIGSSAPRSAATAHQFSDEQPLLIVADVVLFLQLAANHESPVFDGRSTRLHHQQRRWGRKWRWRWRRRRSRRPASSSHLGATTVLNGILKKQTRFQSGRECELLIHSTLTTSHLDGCASVPKLISAMRAVVRQEEVPSMYARESTLPLFLSANLIQYEKRKGGVTQ